MSEKSIISARLKGLLRVVCFWRSKLALATMCAVAASAWADINNLESYRFRYDFSGGKKNFITSENIVGNFVGSSILPVEGPNGAGDAVHITGGAWSQFNSQSVLNSNWTLAMSVKFGNVEGGIVMGLGRLPKNGSKQIALCSSSDKSKLYVRELSRPQNDHTTAGSYTLENLGDVTQGYHTLVIVHSMPPSGNKGTLSFYWDGEFKGSYTTVTDKQFGASSSVCGMQFGQLMTANEGTFSGVKYVATKGNNDYSFYDIRLYAGLFSAADAAAYAALYPYTYPFRPRAYVESNGCNAIDTGVKPSSTIRCLADFQYLDTLGGKRIFGTGTTGVNGEDADGQGVFADLYIDGTEATGGYFARALHGPYVAGSTWIGLNVPADRSRHLFDLDGFNAVSKLYDGNRTQLNTDNVAITSLPVAADAENAISTRLFATKYANNSPTENSTARIYSFAAYRLGAIESFFAPAVDENGNAGFVDIVTGTFHGEEMENPTRALRFYNGLGCASDYKYEGETLFAKVYATVVENGTVSVGGVEAASSGEGWMPFGGSITIVATPMPGYRFMRWVGDTTAIIVGSETEATIEVSAERPLQLRAEFERGGTGFAWTGAGGDGKFSTLANWETFPDGVAASKLPATGDQISFSAAQGGILENDLENIGGTEIVFRSGAGEYIITGNPLTDVVSVVNESSSVQVFSNAVYFASTYNVDLENIVDFAGGARATTVGSASGTVGKTLTGDITFTDNWVMDGAYIVPAGSKLAAQDVTGSGAALTINNGGYAHFASIQPGKNDTVWRINLDVNGLLEVDGNVDYWNSGGGGSVQAVSSSAGTGVIKAKGFYKHGGKQHLTTIKHIKVGAGSAESNPIFGSTYGSNMLHFFQDITLQAMADIEFQSVYDKNNKKENGGLSLHAGKTMRINTEDDDGNGHTVIWGSSFCVKQNNGSSWGYSSGNVRISKEGKGTLVMRNKCSITGSTGYVKDYNGYTDVKGGILRVEEKGQLGNSELTVYADSRFELADGVALPNNAVITGGGNSISIGNNASFKLKASSGDNAAIAMGTGSTLTGNIALGTNATLTVGANSKITGNVTLGVNSVMSTGLSSTIGGNLVLDDGAVWDLTIGPESGAAVAGTVKVGTGSATIRFLGDCLGLENSLMEKVLCKLDSESDASALMIDAEGLDFPCPYSTRMLVREDGEGGYNLVFRALKKQFRVIIR